MTSLRFRWRLLLALLALGVVLWMVVLIGMWLYANRTGVISRANHARIRLDMTEADVNARLGAPGAYDPGMPREPGADYTLCWDAGHITFLVRFDSSGRVVEAYEPVTPPPNNAMLIRVLFR